jgi:hypothetical protein
MFGIGKRTVFKVLKDRPSDFIALSSLADCDIDQSVYAARKLVARLYDQKEKLKAGHVDLNKLRVRLATLKDAWGEVVTHPVTACTAGKILQIIGSILLHMSCTGMKRRPSLVLEIAPV